MNPRSAVLNPQLQPTMAFAGEWMATSLGAARGLPLLMVVADRDGTPTEPFIGLARAAFGTVQGFGLRRDEVLFNRDGTPTDLLVSKWRLWTA